MQLLMSLMQNAVVYGGTGLAVRSWATADAVYAAVGDRGKGLSPEELEQLKASFQRGRNARARTAAARAWDRRLSNGSRGCTAAVCSFMRARAAGWRCGWCCRLRGERVGQRARKPHMKPACLRFYRCFVSTGDSPQLLCEYGAMTRRQGRTHIFP